MRQQTPNTWVTVDQETTLKNNGNCKRANPDRRDQEAVRDRRGPISRAKGGEGLSAADCRAIPPSPAQEESVSRSVVAIQQQAGPFPSIRATRSRARE
jgi:hypothetical protein